MAPRSLLPLVGPRTVPTTTLRLLREVSPFVDVYAPSERAWWLLRFDPDNHARRDEGRKVLARWGREYLPHQNHLLMAAGLSVLKIYDATRFSLDGNSDAVRDDLSLLLNASEKEAEAAYRDALDVSEGVPRDRARVAVFRDYIAAEGRSEHAIHFRHRVSSLTRAVFSPIRSASRSLARSLARA